MVDFSLGMGADALLQTHLALVEFGQNFVLFVQRAFHFFNALAGPGQLGENLRDFGLLRGQFVLEFFQLIASLLVAMLQLSAFHTIVRHGFLQFDVLNSKFCELLFGQVAQT